MYKTYKVFDWLLMSDITKQAFKKWLRLQEISNDSYVDWQINDPDTYETDSEYSEELIQAREIVDKWLLNNGVLNSLESVLITHWW